MNVIDQLKNFLDENGKLKKYPKKRTLKVLSWFYLASKFEFKKRYSEKEINEIIKFWHLFEDWAMLRRELYDAGFFDRQINGSLYWLKEPQPGIEDFDV